MADSTDTELEVTPVETTHESGNPTWSDDTDGTNTPLTADALENIEAAIDTMYPTVTSISTMWKKIYPVGAVYISYTSTSPASLFGGTWTQLTGKFLRMANDISTGGSDTRTLAEKNLPTHKHDLRQIIEMAESESAGFGLPKGGDGFMGRVVVTGTATTNSAIDWNTGGAPTYNTVTWNQAFDNMPAYQDLYAWRRTA